MKPVFLSLMVAPLLSACATDPYGSGSHNGTMAGVLVGGALGALAGRAAGISPVEGAAAGMVAGGVAGYAVTGPGGVKRQYYKDSQGYCYFVDANGVSHYDDPPVRC